MNKLKGSLAAKIIAVILLAASCLALCGAMVAVLWLDSEDAYRGGNDAGSGLIDTELMRSGYGLLAQLCVMPVSQAGDTCPRFELLDADKTVLAGTLGADETVQRMTELRVDGYNGGLYFTDESKPLTAVNSFDWDYSPESGLTVGDSVEVQPTPSPVPWHRSEKAPAVETEVPAGTKVVWLRVSWTDECESTRVSTELRAWELLFPVRYELIALAGIAFVLAVLLFVFLMAAAGHRDDTGAVTPGFVEKIPADLLWALCLLGMFGLFAVINETFSGSYLIGSLLMASACLIAAGLLLLLALMSTAVRLKLGCFLDSCLVWRLLRRIWGWIKAAFGLLRGVPLVWRWIPAFLVLFFLDFAYTMHWRYRSGGMIALSLLLKGLLLAAACLYLALALRRLRDGTKALAAGDEAVTVDTKGLVGELKAQAEDLNHIRDGLGRAVDARMKSERLRTELITNVSHDIKTPLTSIVNYVDLLSKEELNNEKAAEYLEVLQRQSARLKKLTDDLVEASKASTGNLPVSLERLELGVLLDQTAGEYGERLADKGLELRVTKPAEPVYVQADPRHLWRILDNLMSNILKYAQPGTRVYLDLTREGGRTALCFRNISAQPLNIRPEELTERFVRGDSARSTEGSGLGLAIASSLARLQGMALGIDVDGDLFKATLTMQVSA